MRQKPFEDFAGLLPAPDRRERFDKPETADDEGNFRRPEIIRPAIAEQVVSLAQFGFDRRSASTGIAGRPHG